MTVYGIERIVKSVTGVDLETVRNSGRAEHICTARFIYCYMIHKYANMSTNQIGKLINRNHASVLYAIDRVGQWLDKPSIFPAGSYYAQRIKIRIEYYD